MRIKLPEFSEKKELFNYLATKKSELIEQKKSLPIISDIYDFGIVTETKILEEQAKQISIDNTKYQKGEGEIIVDVIANLAGWYDSHNDVLLSGCWNNSIKGRAKKIPFLKNHDWSLNAIVAETLDTYTMEMDLKKMGIKSDLLTAQALIMKGLVKKKYDEKIYYLYEDGMVNQHSIGLQYLQVDLGINDPDYKDEYKIWQKYFSQVVNKKECEDYGFAWFAKEIRIIENSAVLFGANSQTPTIAIDKNKGIDPAATSHNTDNKIEWKHLEQFLKK